MTNFKIMDGGMGSELIRNGLILPKHIWSAGANLTNPTMIEQIHKEYIDAGADYITANTFRATPHSYKKYFKRQGKVDHGLRQARTSLYSAVSLAKKASNNSVKVLGSLAPLEDCYSPQLFPGKDVAISEFTQLGRWLTESGVDILLLETMNSIVETKAGLLALQNFKYPIWVSFVLKNDHCLLSGDSLADAVTLLNDYNVSTALVNCSPLYRTKRSVDIVVDNWSGAWGIYPNLGKGEPSPDGHIKEYQPMEKYLSVIEHALNSGASVVGACCGSSHKHIAEIKKLQFDFSE